MTTVWPFLATRNPFLDWRPIYAPDFLLEANRDFALVLETADAPHQLALRYKRILLGEQRSTIVFRARPSSEYLGGKGTDQFGRPIHVIEGLLTDGWIDLQDSTVERVLDAHVGTFQKVVTEFWQESNESAMPTASAPETLGEYSSADSSKGSTSRLTRFLALFERVPLLRSVAAYAARQRA